MFIWKEETVQISPNLKILARIISGKKLKDVKACWNTLEKLFQFGDIDAANERRSLSEYNTEPFKILTKRITTLVNIKIQSKPNSIHFCFLQPLFATYMQLRRVLLF